ncbi:MAG TPA: hypothetical protein VKT77_05840 [Chthonomonadaceae bacterium]|nr:hypothetical protein [Chthonomonadaceae bacterium]
MKIVPLLGLILLAAASCVRADDLKGPLPPKDRADDPRLERRVTISPARDTIAGLVARLSAASGLELRASRLDPLMRFTVYAVLTDVPVCDAMNALWSAISFPGSVWRWEIEGSKGRYRYTLAHPFRAYQASAELKAAVQRRYLDHAALMLKASQSPPAKRAAMIPAIRRSLGLNDDGKPIDWLLSAPRCAALDLFVNYVPADNQAAILRGDQEATLNLADLDERGKALASTLIADGGRGGTIAADGTLVYDPPPTSIHIYAREDFPFPTLAPCVYFNGSQRIGGPPLEEGLRQWLERQWRMPGDPAADPAEERALVAPAGPVTVDSPLDTSPNDVLFDRRVTELARAAAISVIVAPEDDARRTGPLAMRSKLSEPLRILQESGGMMKKWRGGVLLLAHPLRFVTPDLRQLYPMTESGVIGEQYLSLDDLADIQASLGKKELAKARDRFAVVRAAMPYAPLLAAYRAAPALGSSAGLLLTEDLAAALGRCVDLPAVHDVLTGRARALRIAAADGAIVNVPVRHINVEYQRPDGEWIRLGGFTEVGTPPNEAR